MAFCSRCGELVHGPRCDRCGGLPAAPAVQVNTNKRGPDSWQRTYTSESPPKPATASTPVGSDQHGTRPLTSALKKLNRTFPLPVTSLKPEVKAHIAALSAPRPPSPLKQQYSRSNMDTENMPVDVLQGPDNTQLSKVFGSVLQERDTLPLYSCANCHTQFLPDETIYPDPSSPLASAHSFVCQDCYTTNGGAKGDCAFCGKVVLGLITQGGFIQNAQRVWHKACFRCASCHKNISDMPLVDLAGRPSCEACFGRSPTATSPVTTPTKQRLPNLGGMRSSGARSREGSPALEELQAKLGISSRSREGSPTVEDRRKRTSARFSSPLMTHRSRSTTSLDTTPTKSPVPSSPISASKSSTPTTLAPLQFWSRKLDASPSPGRLRALADTLRLSGTNYLTMHRSHSTTSLDANTTTTTTSQNTTPTTSLNTTPTTSLNTTPTTSLHSTPTKSPAFTSPGLSNLTTSRKSPAPAHTLDIDMSPGRLGASSDTLKGRKRSGTIPLDDDVRCETCRKALFSITGGGRIVRVEGAAFHASCFTCDACRRPFQGDKQGHADYVPALDGRGKFHPECANRELMPPPPTMTFAQRRARTQSMDAKASTGIFKLKSPSMVDLSNSVKLSPALGGRSVCPACSVSVAPMERGVVAGPSGSKWHASCLICGGKGAGGRRDDGRPGCGKKLDSGARCDEDGVAWCRECWMMVPRSPKESPISPTFTGLRSLARQQTGQSLHRQNTGQSTTGIGLGFLNRQNTGSMSLYGSLSRPPSPVKQLGVTHSLTSKPRPQSMGRGLLLVRQMTGSGGNS